MYNIYWSMSESDWHGQDRNVGADTIIQAFWLGVHIIREVLATRDFYFLLITNTEFVIWSQGRCKGFITIKQVGPKT